MKNRVTTCKILLYACVEDVWYILVGVYLPSNPDSVVVEIDKESGTPMQRFAIILIYTNVC